MKVRTLFLAMVAMATSVVMAQEEEGVHFGYDAGAELVSAYIWRGQYNGGLSFQPDLEIGLDGEHTSFRAGIWANLGLSDWKFKTDLEKTDDYNPNTQFKPEIDLVLRATAYGASVGLNHYYYCDGSNFFSWQTMEKIIKNASTSTTEVWAGYNFEDLLGVGAYVNWYTTIAGNDFVWEEVETDAKAAESEEGEEEAEPEVNPKRAWSTYIELGYDYTFEKIGLTIGAQIGMSPWKSDLYGNSKFAVTNLSLKINKEWDFDVFSLDLFAVGSINPDGINKDNAYIKAAGDDKLYLQKLNGAIGLGIWF